MATATTLPTSSVYSGPDVASSAMLHQYEEAVSNFKAKHAELIAATGDREAQIKAYVETSEDAQAVKYREAIAKATALLNELAEKNVQEVSLTPEQQAKLEEEVKSLRGDVRDKKSAVSMVAKSMNIDAENVLKALESIEDPTRGKGSRASAGSTGPRVSATVQVVKDGATDTYDGLSKAATALGCETSELQQAYATAGGVELAEISKVDKVLKFEFKGATVVTTPKPRKNTAKAEETPAVATA